MIQLESVSKFYQKQQALKSISFESSKGEFLSFVGPSGSGKSSLLKIIAEIEKPDAGKVTFSFKRSRETPIILVFQDFQLFPHLTVFENVAFGLRARSINNLELQAKVGALLERLGIAAHHNKFPHRISGGEKQRVALARALVLSPSVLLLDEPFANLDPNLKAGTARFIRELSQELGITTICVSHDFDEAFLMSDRIGVLIDGSLLEIATPRQIYSNPLSLKTAEFLGIVNFIDENDRANLGITQEPNERNWVRAEGLCFEPSSDAKAVVKQVHYYGSRLILEIESVGKTWKVSSLDQSIKPGLTGKLKVRHV